MGFYGKIYEQMGDVFNRAKFINARPDTFIFNAEADDVIIDAESHGDRLPIKAGNSWIAFEPGLDDKGNPACVIYHGAPQKDADGEPTASAKSVIGQITRVPGTSDFLALTDADSTLLTDEEKQALLDTENLLYFGDKILIYSPVRDEAGHISRFERQEWQLGSIPRLADILSAEGRIVTLEDIVGVADYPEEANSLADRTQLLEDDFAEVRNIADKAKEDAGSAQESATNANKAAEAAQLAAEAAAQDAADIEIAVDEFTEATNIKLSEYGNAIQGTQNAIGAINSEQIKFDLDTNSLREWALVMIGVIGEQYNDIRDDKADTITDQIHSNDADIAKLQEDLALEIANRTADVDAEEKARIEAIKELKQYTDTELETLAENTSENLNSAVSALQATDTALNNRIAAEETNRANADTALGSRIDDEITARSNAYIALGNRIADEESARSNADAALGNRIDTEASARETADQAINTRIDGIDTSITGEGGIHARLTAVESKATVNSEKLVGDETVAGSVASKIKTAIDAEANVRNAKDNELVDEIATLADLIADLQSLVEAQQSTITELQEKVVELENIINPPVNPDPEPGEEDEGGEENPPATE